MLLDSKQLAELLGIPLEKGEEIREKSLVEFSYLFKPGPRRRVTTGCGCLDGLLGGGVETGAVTEFVGEFGTGKTQLAHQLAVTVQLPEDKGGLEAKAVYIDTEGTFRPERIIQIAQHQGLDSKAVLKNIFYVRVYTARELLAVLNKLSDNLFENIGLVIVDVLTGLHLDLYADEERRVYESLLYREMLRLIRWAIKEQAAIVVTNRCFKRDENLRILGDPYVCFISYMRILLEKMPGGLWTARVIFSPDGREKACSFKIKEEGVVSVC